MELNWSIAGWVLAILVFYLIGYYEGRSTGYKRRKKEEQQERENQPAALSQPEIVTAPVEDPGLLRIKNEQGAFTLDLDGARVDAESLTSGQRKRLIELLTVMRPWLESRSGPPPVAPGMPPPPPPRPAPVPPPATPPPSRPVSSPPPPPIIAKEDRPPVASNSIVHQIDTILQSRIAGTALEGRGVFLTESPDGGVAVYVGLTRYSGVEEVPDPEIKSAIRAAISEWEDKFTPGL